MRHYRTLSIPPNFLVDPRAGIIAGRTDLAIGQARTLARWPTFNKKTFSATWTTRTPTEIRTLREFIAGHKGPWLPFYLPSWTRDFGCSTTVAIGDTTIDVDRDLTVYLGANRPDTYGRTLYFYTPNGELKTARVLNVSGTGPTWTVTLDVPFSFAADLSRALCGFALFGRFSGDDYRFRHLTPHQAEIDLTFIEQRNRQDIEGTYTLNEEDLYNSEAMVSVTEEDSDPWQSDMRYAEAKGPATYSAAQTFNFANPWTFTLEAGVITMTDGVVSPIPSSLFDGDNYVEHITGAFDVLGDESIAWQKDRTTIRHRWYSSGVPQELEITGRTPVLYQNWVSNGGIAGGDADLVLYYIKPNESKIFARVQRDSFATEYAVAQSPVMPLALIGNYTGVTTHTLRAISTRHTRLSFLSDTYVPPLEPSTDAIESPETTITGSFDQVAVPSAFADTVAGPGEMGITGEYLDSLVEGAMSDTMPSPSIVGISGSIVDLAVRESVTVDSVSADSTVAGSYDLIGIDASGTTESMPTPTTDITGIYELA